MWVQKKINAWIRYIRVRARPKAWITFKKNLEFDSKDSNIFIKYSNVWNKDLKYIHQVNSQSYGIHRGKEFFTI